MQQNTSNQDATCLISIHEALTPQLLNHIYKDSQPAVNPLQGMYFLIKRLIQVFWSKG